MFISTHIDTEISNGSQWNQQAGFNKAPYRCQSKWSAATTPGGGYSKNFRLDGCVCAARVFATIPLATETKSQNRTLGYRKWVKIKPLTIGNVTKLATFEAILHEIGQIWPKYCHLKKKKKKNGGIRSKWPKFPENIPLAMEPQPKLDPWLWKSSQKYTFGYGNWAHI